MSKNLGRYRTHIAALGLVGGLVAAAGAFGHNNPLVIVAPTEVVAGNPINGYATGLEDLCTITGSTFATGPLGPPVFGFTNPLWFSYPTLESMAPGVANIHAADSDESADASVILK